MYQEAQVGFDVSKQRSKTKNRIMRFFVLLLCFLEDNALSKFL